MDEIWVALKPVERRERWWRALSRTRIALVAILIAVLGYVFSVWYPSTRTDSVLKTLAALGVGAGFTLSYLQWRLARREIAFDKFYDRINVTNERINAAGLAAVRGNADKELDHLRNMQVFAQLDNLEYVLGKFELNFVDRSLVERAVQTFRSDCNQNWFSDKVLFWIGPLEGQQVSLGYHYDTRIVARLIVEQCARRPSS